MFIKELVDLNRVSFKQGFSTWQEAIRASFETLLADKSIDETYIDSVIACVDKYGPYIVLAPDIAMPHAQENASGVFQNAIAFMKTEEPVHFEANNPDKDARLFFVLASKDHAIHLKNMEKLATVLLNQDFVKDLLKVNSVEGLLELDAKYS
jgi:PTS system ascorbate-specific IIA component